MFRLVQKLPSPHIRRSRRNARLFVRRPSSSKHYGRGERRDQPEENHSVAPVMLVRVAQATDRLEQIDGLMPAEMVVRPSISSEADALTHAA